MQMWKIVGNQTDLRSSELVKISARTEPCSRSESELCKLWCVSSFLSEIILHVATVNGSVGYFCDVPLGLLRQVGTAELCGSSGGSVTAFLEVGMEMGGQCLRLTWIKGSSEHSVTS